MESSRLNSDWKRRRGEEEVLMDEDSQDAGSSGF